MSAHPAELTHDPRALESLYRQARAEGVESSFREAIEQRLSAHAQDVLTVAWALRLDLPLPELTEGARNAQWRLAVICSITLGLLFALIRGDGPPVPIPEVANTLFWVGWAPLAGVGVGVYIAAFARERLPWIAGACMFGLMLAAWTGFAFWRSRSDAAQLAALHLPFVIWGALGIGLTFRAPSAAAQRYAFIVKSLEIVMTAGVYLGAFMAFAGLTAGIFAVLDVTLPEALILSSIAWGIGAVPIVALASAYQPDRLPTLQDWDQGLAKTLRLLTRLLTPLALLVLAIYLFGYIPMHFGGAFEERELLMVYNATIVAIIMLLCGAASGRAERDNAMLRYALLALTMLTLALNLYALAAIGYRTLELGLTPNRHAVLGWNVVTLLMLAGICHALWTGRGDWVNRFAQRVGALMPAPVGWSLWLLVALPILE